MKDYLIDFVIIIVVLFAIFLSGLYLGYKITHANQLKANDKALKDALTHVQQVDKDNITLSAANATLEATVLEKNQAIANQPVKERIVYVKTKPTAQNPTPAPTAVTSPVFITLGAVSLFNSSFGVSKGASTTGESPTNGSAISSTTISDYENTANKNATACYKNQQLVGELWAYIHSLQAAGFIASK